MDDDDFKLIIEINYDEKTFSIEDDKLIELNDIIKKSIEKFNIDKKLEENIILTFKDEDGDINIITNNEDIVNCSNEIGSKKYLSKLYLNIVSNIEEKQNQESTETQEEISNLKDNKEERKLEEIIYLKDDKINKLEEKIKELQKECQILNNQKNNLLKPFIEANKFENKNTQSESPLIKEDIKNIINDILKNERENIENTIKKFKEDLILDINNNLRKDNENKLNNILEELTVIKENIGNSHKKSKDYEENMNLNYQKSFFNNFNFDMMKPSKIYKCQNCNNSFMFNECFNYSNNKLFKEHNFKLDDLKENINENNEQLNEINILNKEENENHKKLNENIEEKNENKNDINNDINDIKVNNKDNNGKIKEKKEDKKEKTDKKEDKKEEKKKKEEKEKGKNEEQKEEKKEEEKKEGRKEGKNEEEEKDDDDNYEDDLKFQNILRNYFFNDKQELKKDIPTRNELNEIKKYYKIYHQNGKDIQQYQDCFILEVNKEISKLKENSRELNSVNSRKQRLEELLDKFMEEIRKEEEKEKNKNKRKRYHHNNNKY